MENSEPVSSSVSSTPKTQPRWPWRILFGADGLRAGWGLLLFFLLIYLVQHGINGGFTYFHHLNPDEMRLQHTVRTPGKTMIIDGVPFLAVAVVTFLMSLVERRPFRAYGVGATVGAGRQFLAGLFWGFVLLSLLVLSLWGLHYLVFDGRALSGFRILKFGVEWALAFLCVGLFEESISRGYLQFTIARGIAGPLHFTRVAPYSRAIGFWITAILSSYLFGSGHSLNVGESPIGLISAGLIGFVYTLSLWRTGSLWWAIGMHAAWDWSQSFVYGVADSGHMVAPTLFRSHPQGSTLMSGGLTGPEGSVLCLAVIAISAVVVLLTLPNTGWPAPGSRVAFQDQSQS